MVDLVCRFLAQLVGVSLDTWSAAHAEHWDAALAGSSCLREAISRVVVDEAAEVLEAATEDLSGDLSLLWPTFRSLHLQQEEGEKVACFSRSLCFHSLLRCGRCPYFIYLDICMRIFNRLKLILGLQFIVHKGFV